MADPSFENKAESASNRVEHATGKATDAAHRAARRTGEAMDKAVDKTVDKAGDWTDAARGEVRDKPLIAVGVALAAGWLIGRLMH